MTDARYDTIRLRGETIDGVSVHAQGLRFPAVNAAREVVMPAVDAS
jgi:hypothetical protein